MMTMDASIGSALKVIRIHRGISEKRMVKTLTRVTNQPSMNLLLVRVEDGNGGIENLDLFCKVLKVLPLEVHRVAAQLRKNSDRPEREILQELIELTRDKIQECEDK